MEQPFDELISDTGLAAQEDFVKGVLAQWRGIVGPREKDKAREILIGIVEENVERLEALLEKRQQNPAEQARRKKTRQGFEKSPEGDAIRRYMMRCISELRRGMVMYKKYKKDGGKGPEPRDDRMKWTDFESGGDGRGETRPRAGTH